MKFYKFVKIFFWFFIFFWIFIVFLFSFIYINPHSEERPLWVYLDETRYFTEPSVKFYELNEPVFLIYNGNNFVAVSAICPFRRAILEYDSKRNIIICPAHGEEFDLNGNPLNKKVKRLKRYSVSIKGGKIYVLLGKAD